MENMDNNGLQITTNKEILDGMFEQYSWENSESNTTLVSSDAYNKRTSLRTTSTLDFHTLKNQVYMHLLDDEIYNYFDQVVSSQKGTQTLEQFMANVEGFKEYKKRFEAEVDDYSFIALRRLRLFTELNSRYLKDYSPSERKNMRSWHKIQMSATNFIGHCTMNGILDRNLVVWGRADYLPKLIKNKLVKKDAPKRPHIFLLFYKKGSEYPSSEIFHLDEQQLDLYDPTDVTRVMNGKQLVDVENSHIVNIWDTYEFLQEGLVEGSRRDIKVVKPIHADSPQKRLKFYRTYYSGMSQTQLANEMMSNFGTKINQKNIEYWEKSKSDIPAFFKGDTLEQMATILVESSFHFYQREFNMGSEPALQKSEIIRRLVLNIKKYPNETTPPHWINQLHKPTERKEPKSVMGKYNDAVRRYGLEEKMNKKSLMTLDQVSQKRMVDWFYVFANTTEFELLKDMSMVYDNDKTRAKVYNLWRRIVSNTIYPNKQSMFGS